MTAIAAAHVESYRDLPLNAVPDTDQVPGRAPAARGTAARARVLDEGRLLVRRRSGVASTPPTSGCGSPTATSSGAAACPPSRWRPTAGPSEGRTRTSSSCPRRAARTSSSYSDESGYAANVERATSAHRPRAGGRRRFPIELVDTPGVTTIADLAACPSASRRRRRSRRCSTRPTTETVLVTIRGDIEVNEVKLKNHLHCLRAEAGERGRGRSGRGSRPARRRRWGCPASGGSRTTSITAGRQLRRGREPARQALPERELPARLRGRRDNWTSRRRGRGTGARTGKWRRCKAVRGIEVGHVFKLGTFFTDAMGVGVNFLDGSGSAPIRRADGVLRHRRYAGARGRHRAEPRREGRHLPRAHRPVPGAPARAQRLQRGSEGGRGRAVRGELQADGGMRECCTTTAWSRLA